MADFKTAQNIVKKIEGGYQDMYNDSGNWDSGKVGIGKLIGTKYGISAPTLKNYLKRDITKEDMINLSYDVALDIYKKNYWDAMQLTEIKNQSVANLIYQTTVHFGVAGAKRIIQNASGRTYGVDYLNLLDQEKLFNAIKLQLIGIYSKNEKWGKAFLNRLKYFTFSK